jgi:PIN domain nuclease of toxin-antitoxin system
VNAAHLGLSLGDRACLATALDSGGDVVTLDRSWGGVDLGVPILLLR